MLRFVATSTSSVIWSSSYGDVPVIPTATSASATVDAEIVHWTTDQKITQASVAGLRANARPSRNALSSPATPIFCQRRDALLEPDGQPSRHAAAPPARTRRRRPRPPARAAQVRRVTRRVRQVREDQAEQEQQQRHRPEVEHLLDQDRRQRRALADTLGLGRHERPHDLAGPQRQNGVHHVADVQRLVEPLQADLLRSREEQPPADRLDPHREQHGRAEQASTASGSARPSAASTSRGLTT